MRNHSGGPMPNSCAYPRCWDSVGTGFASTCGCGCAAFAMRWPCERIFIYKHINHLCMRCAQRTRCGSPEHLLPPFWPCAASHPRSLPSRLAGSDAPPPQERAVACHLVEAQVRLDRSTEGGSGATGSGLALPRLWAKEEAASWGWRGWGWGRRGDEVERGRGWWGMEADEVMLWGWRGGEG